MCGLYDGVVEAIQNPDNLYRLAENLNVQLVTMQSFGMGPGGPSEIELALTLQAAVQRLKGEEPRIREVFPRFEFPPDHTLDKMVANAVMSLRRNGQQLPQS